jgi:hypothetical protein
MNLKENKQVIKIEYKKGCGFRRINLCKFKIEDCHPKKENKEMYCSLYDIPFDSKSIKKEMDIIKKDIAGKVKQNLKIKEVKKMLKKEKKDKQDKEVLAYKKRLHDIKDMDQGYQILKTAYTHCKRTKK